MDSVQVRMTQSPPATDRATRRHGYLLRGLPAGLTLFRLICVIEREKPTETAYFAQAFDSQRVRLDYAVRVLRFAPIAGNLNADTM